MDVNTGKKLLFVINNSSGPGDTSWEEIIGNYFTGKNFTIKYFLLDKDPDADALKKYIISSAPDKIIAVGGDGTVTLTAKAMAGTKAVLGILPAGSANGMAKELGISEVPAEALTIIENGTIQNCDAIKINGNEISLHLADIGLNAQLIKYFSEGNLRGKLGYAKVLVKTLWRSQKMNVIIRYGEEIKTAAFMVVLANASKYGTGAVINPDGKLDDGLFEIIIVRKLSVGQLLKMMVHPKRFNPQKIEILPARSVTIETIKKVHFQVDGEYLGKVNKIKAEIIKDYLKIIIPAGNEHE